MGEEQLIIVHSIDDMPRGEFTSWPRHITLVPWFVVRPGELGDLKENLTSFASGTGPLSVTVGKDAKFGERQNVPVQTIKPSSELRALHEGLLNVVEQHAVLIAPNFTCEQFRPHITKHKTKTFRAGRILRVANFHLVSREGDDRNTPRNAIGEFVLGHETEA